MFKSLRISVHCGDHQLETSHDVEVTQPSIEYHKKYNTTIEKNWNALKM